MYGMDGCCAGLGDAPLKPSFPWGYLGNGNQGDYGGYLGDDYGYLGQDETDAGGIMGPTLEEAAGGPVDTITAGDIATYMQTGQADPSVLTQITNLIKAGGSAAQNIMQQVQFGQLAANTPVAQLSQLRTAITGQTSVQSVISSLTSNPVLLIGGAVLLVFLLKRR